MNFIIVGDGPEYAAVKTQVDNQGLQSRVFLPGKVSQKELMNLFQSCDIFCLPSIERTEAFGLVLLEAMYFGIPLITTRIKGSGVNEVNQHGYTGLQVPTADTKAIVEAIDDLKTNTKKRLTMGNMAQNRFNHHYHIRPVAGKIEKLYMDISF